ncbi:MAG: peptidoglycan DD-metalloendopeptidase family protein [Bacillota bacterium]|nr:peptidoglycan DD-metalloendopeptidase family protein [Bacillota bacterium]MDW7682744.1 peptidoglycan DD-metalloendopeptidase family protein [Bacillota bacterium]
MKNRTYTILIVSNGGKAPVNFRLSTIILAISAFLLVMVTAGVTTLAVTNTHLSAKAALVPVLEDENSVLQAELSELENELALLNGQMAELEVLGQQVRTLVSESRSALPDRSGTPGRASADTEETISYLREKIPEKTEELELLKEDAEVYKDKMERTPDLKPVSGRVTSPFGWRRGPFTQRLNFHNGVDFGAPFGTPVYAAASGRVVSASYKRGWGNLVIISHGTYNTFYAHLRTFSVKPGEIVEKGQKIAQVGSTGNSTGPHLHFEIHKNGTPLDPLKMLKSEVTRSGL